jgi:hypothetical protein
MGFISPLFGVIMPSAL